MLHSYHAGCWTRILGGGDDSFLTQYLFSLMKAGRQMLKIIYFTIFQRGNSGMPVVNCITESHR